MKAPEEKRADVQLQEQLSLVELQHRKATLRILLEQQRRREEEKQPPSLKKPL